MTCDLGTDHGFTYSYNTKIISLACPAAQVLPCDSVQQ